MERKRGIQYPMSCPVCRNAMVGEKSDPDIKEYDVFNCLNCGATVISEDSGQAEPNE